MCVDPDSGPVVPSFLGDIATGQVVDVVEDEKDAVFPEMWRPCRGGKMPPPNGRYCWPGGL